ncbi:telomere length regulation protein TEL2 homolog [Argonauta hians]
MSKQELNGKVINLLKEVHAGLSSADPYRIIGSLDSIVALISASKITIGDESNVSRRTQASSDPLLNQYFPNYGEKCLARDCFLRNHFSRFVDLFLSKLSMEWVEKLDKTKLDVALKVVFLRGNHSVAFLTLLHHISTSSPSYNLNRCVLLLENFVTQHCLLDVMWNECIVEKGYIPQNDVANQELVNAIISLPSKTANKLKDQNSLNFYPAAYTKLLCQDIVQVLYKAHQTISSCQDCSLLFVSHLFASLCSSGYSDELWNGVLPELMKNAQEDFLWQRICKRLVTGAPDRSIESVIVPLLSKVPWYGIVEMFLADIILDRPKVKYLLCTKILLHRYFTNTLLLQNIFGYLASSTNRHPIFLQVIKTLVKIWGDASAIRHTSYEQHYYISSAIIICNSFLSGKEDESVRKDIVSAIMYGMQNHLESINGDLHRLGMVVTELVVAKLQADATELKFTYEISDDIKVLQNLAKPPDKPKVAENIAEVSGKCPQPSKPSSDNTAKKESQEKVSEQQQSDLDSDDDFEPFDMSNDKQEIKVKTPKYLRDCMEGLIGTEDCDRIESCLKVAEELIYSSHYGLTEIAAEFAKILLHLTESHSFTSLLDCRLKALVALLVECPVETANYLTSQVYARNYNIRQRMDILSVLSVAAQKLASPKKSEKKDKCFPEVPITASVIQQEESLYNWREIVQKRIDSKTRYFSKNRNRQQPECVVNRFSSVAGHFFYPLIKGFDRKDNCLDLLGDDCMVLERLLMTLGTVLYSAVNTMAVKQMGQCLLEFIWPLRYHPQSSIRRAILFGISAVYLSVPSHVLLAEMEQDSLDYRQWLQDTAKSDPDTECQRLAVQTLKILHSVIQQELSTD